jgi:hypothetical protein
LTLWLEMIFMFSVLVSAMGHGLESDHGNVIWP